MAWHPDGIWEGFSSEQLARLESTEVPLGYGHTRSAADLIVGWASHVRKLFEERNLLPGEDRDAWTAHDYVATLIMRGMVGRALDLLDGELRSRAVQVVERFDDLLRSFTEADHRQVVRRFAAEDAGAQWWWQRIPRSGPVRAELLRFADRVGLR